MDVSEKLATKCMRLSHKCSPNICRLIKRIPKVRPYLNHGFPELDNNTAERAMRPIAIGRKNYLFLGSEKGGKSAAISTHSSRPAS